LVGRIFATDPAPVVNLSETGALVETPRILRPGTVQMLRLPLPAAGELVLRCRVVRSFVHGMEGPEESVVRYRAALEFVGLSGEERVALRARVRDEGNNGNNDNNDDNDNNR
jgi:hypothetical protein